MVFVGIVSLLGVASLAQAAAIDRRAPTYPGTCPSLSGLVSGAGSTTDVMTFCTAFFGIKPKTITTTTTVVRATVTKTGTAYTTTTSIVTPADATSTIQTTTTGRVTTTLAAVTSTATVTSTAYLDNDGGTITMLKRDLPTEVVKRALATPAVFSGWARASVTSACNCMHPATPTITRTSTAFSTATANAQLSRTIKSTTTLAVNTDLATVVSVKTQTLVAPAPIVTGSAVEIDTVEGCPPSTTSTFLCPEDTGDDDFSMSADDKIACSVTTPDSFYGYCAYWGDDGSPAGTTLVQDDPAHPGDAAYQTTRQASYGDDSSDDCPTWADWTCSPEAGGSRFRRAVLALTGENPVVRVALDLEPRKPKSTAAKKKTVKTTKKVSTKKATSTKKAASSTKAASIKPTSTKAAAATKSSAPKSNGKHPYNNLFDMAPPARGGAYVPWTQAAPKLGQ